MTDLPLPAPVRSLIRRLEDAGYPVYAVGGYLRDFLLGLKTHDIDLATAARPEETVGVLADYRIIPTGLQHGTLTVLAEGLPVEVTTFRQDGSYSDHRRPDRVRFTSSIREDLSRRDFTINAMAWRREEGWIDPWGGRPDLESRIVRAVGDPVIRFREDALRILRAVRLSSELGFRIEEETEKALMSGRELLVHVASERTRIELERLLGGRDAERVLLEFDVLLETVLPELAFLLQGDGQLYRRAAKRAAGVRPDPVLRFAAFLHEAESPEAVQEAARRLRFSRSDTARIVRLTRAGDLELEAKAESIWPAWQSLGEKLFSDLLELRSVFDSQAAAKIRREARDLSDRGRLLQLSGLALDGHDLQKQGYRGSRIGCLLQELLRRVCEEGLPNQKERLLQELPLIDGRK